MAELWKYRELVFFLVWRDVKVRYKQTILGIAWAVFQPLSAMLLFSLFFGRLARMPSDNLPYPVFALAGLVPWMSFSFGLSEAANSLVANRQLITKVYLPRLAVPLAPVLAALVDFAIAFVLLVLVMASYDIVPGVRALLVVPFVILVFMTALGAGFGLAALNVQYRDVRYLLPSLIQLWLFASPIAYPSSLLPADWHAVYGLNPMAGAIDGFRWALLGADVHGPMIAVSFASALTLLAVGLIYFRRMERVFADVV